MRHKTDLCSGGKPERVALRHMLSPRPGLPVLGSVLVHSGSGDFLAGSGFSFDSTSHISPSMRQRSWAPLPSSKEVPSAHSTSRNYRRRLKMVRFSSDSPESSGNDPGSLMVGRGEGGAGLEVLGRAGTLTGWWERALCCLCHAMVWEALLGSEIQLSLQVVQ